MKLKLPIGIQTFKKLRENNCVYVDKTKYLVDLIENVDVCFFARPRRFGKSLTISTFEALFSGEKELFKGLAAEEFLYRHDFKPHPVISLNMSDITTNKGLDAIEESICTLTNKVARNLKIKLSNTKFPGDLFSELITSTAEKYNQKAVILIDEYDMPYTEFVNDPDMAEKVRDLLRNFYSRIKSNDKDIRFVFITGISKFTKMGVFSSLNNLVDISPDEQYGEMCGYTEAEIIKYLPEYLDETANEFGITVDELVEKMREYYNGFCFDFGGKHRLYNPFSTLCFFQKKKFLDFWFESGTPAVIAKYLKTKKITVEQFRNVSVSKDLIYNSVEIEKAVPENFLFQTGYLSLRPGTVNDFSLDYPNAEVLNSMSKLATQNILHDNNEDYTYCRNDLLNALITMDYDMVVNVFNRLLASIPYDDFSAAANQNVYINSYKFPPREWLYRSTILAFLRGCGVVVIAEMHTNSGRADLVLAHKGKTWVIEIKVAYKGESPAKKADEALRQIIDRNYAKPYRDAFCMGFAIKDSIRQITDARAQHFLLKE